MRPSSTPKITPRLGQGVRDILKNDGGAEALRERYEQVSAYHNDNYRPLMWPIYRPYRAAIFRLSRLLTFRSATQDESLIDALDYIQSYQHTRRDYLPAMPFHSTLPVCAGRPWSNPVRRWKPFSIAGSLRSASFTIWPWACKAAMSTSRAQRPMPTIASN